MRGLAALQRDHGFSDLLSYQQAGGSETDRGIGGRLAAPARAHGRGRSAASCRPARRRALMALLLAMTRPGDVVLTDRLTYPGFKAAAASLGVRLVGVEADDEGMIPEALAEAACTASRQGRLSHADDPQSDDARRSVAARREQLAAAIRRRDLAAVRRRCLRQPRSQGAADRHADSRAQLSCGEPRPNASRPDCACRSCWRPIAPLRRRSPTRSRTVSQMPVPLMVALVLRWLTDGSADAIICGGHRRSCGKTEAGGQGAFGVRVMPRIPKGIMSGWRLPPAWTRAEFAAHVQRQGLAVVTSDSFSVDGHPRARHSHCARCGTQPLRPRRCARSVLTSHCARRPMRHVCLTRRS